MCLPPSPCPADMLARHATQRPRYTGRLQVQSQEDPASSHPTFLCLLRPTPLVTGNWSIIHPLGQMGHLVHDSVDCVLLGVYSLCFPYIRYSSICSFIHFHYLVIMLIGGVWLCRRRGLGIAHYAIYMYLYSCSCTVGVLAGRVPCAYNHGHILSQFV